METLFHITSHAEWAAAQRKHIVSAPSLMVEGFIHCSLGKQLSRVFATHFTLVHEVTLLTIEADLLDAPLKYEGTPEAYPHVYGAIALKAVTKAQALRRSASESWESVLKRLNIGQS